MPIEFNKTEEYLTVSFLHTKLKFVFVPLDGFDGYEFGLISESEDNPSSHAKNVKFGDPDAFSCSLNNILSDPIITVTGSTGSKFYLDFYIGDKSRDYCVVRVKSIGPKKHKAVNVRAIRENVINDIWIDPRYPYGELESFDYDDSEVVVYTTNSEIVLTANVEEGCQSSIHFDCEEFDNLTSRRIVDFKVSNDIVIITFDYGQELMIRCKSSGDSPSWFTSSIEKVFY